MSEEETSEETSHVEESSAKAEKNSGAKPAAASSEPRRRDWTDTAMRGLVFLGLAALITTPIYCKQDVTQNFQRPTTFAADRSEEETLEGRLASRIRTIITHAVRDEEVEEATAIREIADLLATEDLGTAEERNELADDAVSNILARAAETSDLGFAAMQDAAIRGQSQIVARQLIVSLGGEVSNGGEEAPPGDWTPASWPALSNFEYTEGMDLPADARALDDTNVMAWGYLLHLMDDQYLLVQNLWSCCFGRAPDLHEAIVVRLREDGREYEGRGVRLYGKLEVGELREDGFVTSLYRLDADHLRPM